MDSATSMPGAARGGRKRIRGSHSLVGGAAAAFSILRAIPALGYRLARPTIALAERAFGDPAAASGGQERSTAFPALAASAAVFSYLAAMYGAQHYVLSGRLDPDLDFYLVRPILWTGLAALSFFCWQRLAERPRGRDVRRLTGLAAFAGLFHVSVLVIAGMLFGFGHSGYARQALHIAENILYLGTLLLGLEMSRAYLLHAWSRVSPLAAFAAVALLFAAVAIAPGQYTILGSSDRAFETTGRSFLPGLSASIMTTFLASVGGPLPALAYRGVLTAFEWFSPALPQLEWTVAAFIGAVTPMFAMLVVRDAIQNREEPAAEEEKERGLSPVFLLASALVVGLIWLNTGLLGVKPALVSGASMKPTLGAGDIVVTRKSSPETLKPGDIIRFRLENRSVLHRINTIERTSSGIVLVTQGDNNNTPDPPITAEQIEGKVVMRIPEIGWVPIGVQKVLEKLR